MGFLAKFFSGRAQKKEYKRQQSELLDAIRNKEPNRVNEIVGRIDDLPKFLHRTVSDLDIGLFDTRLHSRLLEEAIATDDVETFKAVFSIGQNPNHHLYSWSFGMHGGSSGYDTLLQRAMRDRKKDIALFLARHPDLDINEAGGSSCFDTAFESKDRVLGKPLDYARQAGLDDVVQILAQRQLDQLQNEARNRPPSP